jgi:ABC-type multidrug transport system ATPase subunit
MLEVMDLTKRYEDGLPALDHLNMRAVDGELFCLLGANWAGNTTTINCSWTSSAHGETDRCGWGPRGAVAAEAKRRLAYVVGRSCERLSSGAIRHQAGQTETAAEA